MNKTKKRIQEFVDTHRDELVLDLSWSVSRLLGWTDDADDQDYYYVLWDVARADITLSTCVGKPIPLIGIDPQDYEQLENVWKLNYPTIPDLERELEAKPYNIL